MNRQNRGSLFAFALLLCLLLHRQAHAQPATIIDPQSMALCGGSLWVADGESGQLRRVDPESGQLLSSTPFTAAVTQVVALNNHHLAINLREPSADTLCFLRIEEEGLRELSRLKLDVRCHQLAANASADTLCVTAGIDPTIQLVRLPVDRPATLAPPLRLPFPTGCVQALAKNRFLIADLFSGGVAIVDGTFNIVLKASQLPAHQIRSLCPSPDGQSVYVAHQRLSRLARTSFDDVHWGNLVQNMVTRLALADLLADREKIQFTIAGSELLGKVGDGFADPTVVCFSDAEQVVISGGTARMQIGRGAKSKRLTLIGRPVEAIPLGNDRLIVRCANRGAIDCYQWQEDKVRSTWLLLAPHAQSPLGRQAFYDGRLAHDGWMSCNSCHVDGHTPDLSVDTLGDGDYGAAKRIPTLFGVGATAPYGWLGNQVDLASQLEQTLQTTMHTSVDQLSRRTDLEDFLESLPASPTTHWSTAEAVVSNTEAVARGAELFQRWECQTCHCPPTLTSAKTYDVGMQDELKRQRFNPPSLVGVRWRSKFFHDGRAADLEAVLTRFGHRVPEDARDVEVQDLLQYLRTL